MMLLGLAVALIVLPKHRRAICRGIVDALTPRLDDGWEETW